MFTVTCPPCTVGKIVHYMTGHQDAVTGLAIDHLGQYLVSGGERREDWGGGGSDRYPGTSATLE